MRDEAVYSLGGVSIHAPREGCDGSRSTLALGSDGFNSRTPGGVRPKRAERHISKRVSIHAPREGCD